MFNVNNTYIRISGCIINVPLKQEDKNTDYIYAIGTSQEGGNKVKKNYTLKITLAMLFVVLVPNS